MTKSSKITYFSTMYILITVAGISMIVIKTKSRCKLPPKSPAAIVIP